MQLRSGSLIGNLPGLLYMEGYLLQNMNSLNPSSPTLRGTGEYVLSLCGKYLNQAQTIVNNLGGSKPIITGPSNQSGNVGFNAVFSVSVISATPTSFQWFQNGVAVPGATTATLTIFNAQLAQSGSTFFVIATNASGSTVSSTASLTVTQALTGSWYAGGTDYSTLLVAGTDTVAYSGTFSITDGQPFNVPLPIGQSDFVVIKYPVSQALRVHYANPVGGIDQASIPGLAFDQNTFGGNNYTFSRNGNQFGINNTTGIVQFS